MQPSSDWYWHIGEMTMRLGSVMPPSWSGVKSLGSGNLDLPFFERPAQRFGELDRALLVAMDAERIGRDRHLLAGKARDVALLAHRERLLHDLVLIPHPSAGLVARSRLAFFGYAATRRSSAPA